MKLKVGDMIEIIDPHCWGIITSFSDDGSTIYYKRFGTGFFSYSTTANKVRLTK